MESQGIMWKITEAMDWVSSAVYPQKLDGDVRVCIDPKHLNMALKGPHHKTPTLEEVTNHFRGAKVFSKLDAKSSYLSPISPICLAGCLPKEDGLHPCQGGWSHRHLQ